MIQNIIAKIPKRKPDSHKGDYGHVFVIAGSIGMTGAAYLTSQAAMLSGSGLVTLGAAKSINEIMEVKLTEVMTLSLMDTKDGSLSLFSEKDILDFSKSVDVVVIGPGLSKNRETQHLARNLIRKIEKPLVIDADGINAMAGHREVIKYRRYKTVITPHPGEMAKLINRDIEYINQHRERIAKTVSRAYNCITVLKGYKTVVTSSLRELYINDTGNAGMSTAGAGDVLTGMVASFIGQGIDLFSSAVLAVYLHGKAGDLAAREYGQSSLIASNILDKIPIVLKDIV